MRHISRKLVSTKLVYVLVMISLLIGAGSFHVGKASGAQLTTRALKISDGNASANATYEVSYTIATVGTLGSIMVEFCDNSPLFGETCNAPPGFDISNATLSDQTGETGFTIDAINTTNNVLVLTRVPSAASAGPVSYTLDDVVNASSLGSSYARFSTFQSIDASGPSTDEGAVAYSLNDTFNIDTEVPPYLIFCVGNSISGTDCNTATGNYVNLGDLGPTHASFGQTQMLTGTNADGGYTIHVNGATMTSGNNIIPALTTQTPSALGTSQFGINLRNNSNPDIGQDTTGPGVGTPTATYSTVNQFKYVSGDILAASSNADDYRKYTVSYLVNVSSGQAPGVYTSTFTYTATGNF